MTPRPPLIQKINPFYAFGEGCYSGVSPGRIERRCGSYVRHVGRVARDFDQRDIAEDARDAVSQLMGRIGPRSA